MIISLEKMGPLFICIRFCWRNIGGRAWMSLATSHLHTARLWASSPRVFEHFIHSLNPEHRLPETSECLGMQSCSKTWQEGSLSFTPSEWLQRKWPHQAVSVLAFSQKCSLPGQQSCPVCIHRTLLLVPTWVPAKFPRCYLECWLWSAMKFLWAQGEMSRENEKMGCICMCR